ncbi:DUF1996 domain-containing protein [Glycomyces sp. TRM65418]|uniref:DUF1996 domain-containing protein n=1 Tax=Glycomyces sp. TRM65418 TaxID=2867006 RepID=UPI001CE51C07|nr:DUF1996 domain-containing protein [Glycomyces sp. TRM65418]MCC3763538.1 DUF1996 domain-containing protein [Glycomyces sp. TRM65418]QZD57521.1 DUF1996 domain-containing protein [Glycomyces sp. TRM65418]
MKRTLAAAAAAALALAASAAAAVPTASADELVTHHEFQANCTISHTAHDDPIVFPDRPGASHHHTFLGNTGTDAYSTPASLQEGGTTCLVPADRSAYWFPTLFNGDEPALSTWHQVIYYKSGVEDYTTVVPFPAGLRFVVGDPRATTEEFQNAPGTVEGYECGESAHNYTFPAHCPDYSWLNIRYQAPSCWDGVNLDSPDHRSHMAYPVGGTCPASHPVPVPMLEFKIHFPVNGDMSQVRLASGAGASWHYDFMNAWEPETLAALVEHCVNGGLQCDSRGYDLYKPDRGAVLDEDYELIDG